ncbi:MAG: hypothetical protein DDT32_02170 [Syntrophomonadaceae bacterium]|nr:hypothetical protein [Bacillota bacterium]
MFGVFSILLLVTFFGNVWLEYGRAMRYTIFAATILNGIGLYTLFHNWNKKAGTIAIVLLLIASGIIGVFNTHPSPIVRSVNFQVTDMEMTGMRWFLDHRDEDILVDNIDVNQSRFTDAIRGRQEVIPNIRYKALPLDHFGYPDYVMFGESFREDRYFVDGKISRIVGPEVFPKFEHLWKFTPEDFQRLDNEDPSVSKVYSNGEFWVYFVRGMGTLSP